MNKRLRKKPKFPATSWTTEQDCYLIEHSFLSIDQLSNQLPFNQDEILERKETLGLSRRMRQLRKIV